VAPGSQRCVDVRSIRFYVQPFQHLVQQHRHMWFCPASHRASQLLDTNSATSNRHLQTHHWCRAPRTHRACPNFKFSTWPDLCPTGPTSYTPNELISSSVSCSFFRLSTTLA
jgi:hypothetical protein